MLIIRRDFAPLNSKQTFSPWRGGSKHYMLQALLPTYPGWRGPHSHKAVNPNTKYCQKSLDYAVRHDSHKAYELRDCDTGAHPHITSYGSEHQRDLLTACTQVFPRQPAQATTKAWKSPPVQVSIQQLWKDKRALRSYRQASFRLPRLLQLFQPPQRTQGTKLERQEEHPAGQAWTGQDGCRGQGLTWSTLCDQKSGTENLS